MRNWTSDRFAWVVIVVVESGCCKQWNIPLESLCMTIVGIIHVSEIAEDDLQQQERRGVGPLIFISK